jgi:hypothetical protein
VTVSWIASSPVTTCGITSTSRSWNVSHGVATCGADFYERGIFIAGEMQSQWWWLEFALPDFFFNLDHAFSNYDKTKTNEMHYQNKPHI